MADNIQGLITELESNGQDVDGADGLFSDNTLAHFDNTFVTHIDDFTMRQMHNILINRHFTKSEDKRGIDDKIYLKTEK